MLIILLVCLVPVCGRAAVTWDFTEDSQVVASNRLTNARVSGGLFHGTTVWDPHLSLRLPGGGIDGKKLTHLTVDLYSSAPADWLAVYYKCPDGRWALGRSYPIRKGFAEYRVDLRRLSYGGDVAPMAGSRQWGGTTGRLVEFRLDPGNQAGRWIAIDRVVLTGAGEGPFTPGVTLLSEPVGELMEVKAPAVVTAGDLLRVTVTARLPASRKPCTDRLLIWLTTSDRPWAEHVGRVAAKPGTNRWTVRFPTGKRAQPVKLSVRVGLLRLKLRDAGYGREQATVEVVNPLAGTRVPPLVEIKPLGGDPALFVNGEPVAPFFVSVVGRAQHAQQREMGVAGIHLFSDWFGASGASDLGHVAPDKYDYIAFDRYFAETLAADPDAWFLPHIGVTPPMWWQQAHPEELCVYADGGHGPQSFASRRWRNETAADLRRLLAHLQSAPYADRILGYIPYSGYTAEWQSWGLWRNRYGDYSKPAQEAWRRWLQKRYGPGSPRIHIPLPTLARRHHGRWGALRDPGRERTVIDYYQFLADLTADCIEYWAHVVKEATHGRSLCGTYYGYLTEHGQRQQDSSHLALHRVLDCPDVDFLMSPPRYTDRNLGGAAGFMSATESVRLHGKLWLSEADYRTHLSAPGSGYGRVADPAGTKAVLWREVANVLTRRTAVTYMDMVGGWLAGPEVTGELGKMRAALASSLKNRRPFHGEVAVVIDERSFTYTTAMHPLVADLSLHSLTNLPRVGAAWDLYLLDDLGDPDLPPHKLYLFLNAFKLDDRQRALLHSRLTREHATAVWIYAPGLYGQQTAGTEPMEAVTGIPLVRQTWNKPLRVTAADGTLLAGGDTVVDPVFLARDAHAEVLGVMEGTSLPGIVRRRFADWTSVFSSAPRLTPAFLRRLARDAGCHLYLTTGDPLFVDNGYLGLHAATSGRKTLHLRRPARPSVIFGGAAPRGAGTRYSVDMERNHTLLLRLAP